MSSHGSTTYTQGFRYKCGRCKKVSPEFKEEKGVLRWRRLHFKLFPFCEKYHHQHGLGGTASIHHIDMAGRRRLAFSGRTGQYTAEGRSDLNRLSGHQKHMVRENLEYETAAAVYQRDAASNEKYLEQIAKDARADKVRGIIYEDDVAPVVMRIKKKKKKKKKRN